MTLDGNVTEARALFALGFILVIYPGGFAVGALPEPNLATYNLAHKVSTVGDVSHQTNSLSSGYFSRIFLEKREMWPLTDCFDMLCFLATSP